MQTASETMNKIEIQTVFESVNFIYCYSSILALLLPLLQLAFKLKFS